MSEQEETNKNNDNSSSLWSWGGALTEGLSAISAAATTTTTTINPDGEAAEPPSDIGATKAEIQEMESAIAAAENVVSSTIFSTLEAVTNTFSTAAAVVDQNNNDDATTQQQNKQNTLSDRDLDVLLDDDDDEQVSAKKEEKTELSHQGGGITSSFWSTITSVASESLDPTDLITSANNNNNNMISSNTPGVASTILNFYSTNVNKASEWIEDLQHAEEEKDPHQHLKSHLEQYLSINSDGGSFEEWIHSWSLEQGWGETETIDFENNNNNNNNNESEESSEIITTTTTTTNYVIDPSYYQEESIYRNLWNERNHQDGIDIHDLNPLRKYVPAARDHKLRTNNRSSLMMKEQQQQTSINKKISSFHQEKEKEDFDEKE